MVEKAGRGLAGEREVAARYDHVIDGWNQRDAHAFASGFSEDGQMIGFDGSQVDGREEILSNLTAIFDDHVTAPYTGVVKEVRLLTPGVALLRAIAGMIPVGQSTFNPDLNALHTLVATKTDGRWRIALFQATPAQMHGRPDLVATMTDELRRAREGSRHMG